MIRTVITAAILVSLVPAHTPIAFSAEGPIVGAHIEKSEAEMSPTSSFYDQNDLDMLAKTVWGEARGLDDYEKSMVVWCILNRVDHGYYGDTIADVITAPYQFAGYDPDFPIEEDIVEICRDVLTRWETDGAGRTLPCEYVDFTGDGKHNYFTDRNGNIYDFSAPDPYEEAW